MDANRHVRYGRVSSLRLVKENMNTQEAMSIAMNFEHKAFQDVADKVSRWSPTANHLRIKGVH